jgi:hypothetical protein
MIRVKFPGSWKLLRMLLLTTLLLAPGATDAQTHAKCTNGFSFIDKTGVVVMPSTCALVSRFSEGLVPVSDRSIDPPIADIPLTRPNTDIWTGLA